jgi:hypothetical protein
MSFTRVTTLLWALGFLTTAFTQGAGQVMPKPAPLPNPVLVFMGAEEYEANGKRWTRYRYAVDNSADYPNELFAAAPELPPCGQNTRASRTWVDLYEQGGRRLNGFCAIGDRAGLSRLWFAVESGTIPPSWIYIEMIDRKTNTKLKSNLAESTM